jgi:hypothetical protein
MTLAEIESDMTEYADYDAVASVSRARLYVVACRRWIQLVAGSAGNQGSSLSRNVQQVHDMMKRAEEYISANANSGSRVRFLSVERGFR